MKFIVSASETKDRDGDGVIEDYERGVEFEEEYEISDFPQMAEAFVEKQVDETIGCDKWGCWLSGYAPIFDESGQAVAIVGVDIPADEIIRYEQNSRWLISSIIGVIFFCFPLFLVFLSSAHASSNRSNSIVLEII